MSILRVFFTLVTAKVKAVETKARKKLQLGKASLKAAWKNQERKFSHKEL